MGEKFNKSVNKSNGLANWLEDFINGLVPKSKEVVAEVEDKNKVSTAEINVKDLQKIVWNDETFYVNFQQNGAQVLNEFGNEVTNIPNAKSVDDVDKALNSQQITATVETEEIKEEEDFDTELSKIIASIEEQTEENESDEDPVLDAIVAGFDELEQKISSFEKKLALIEQTYARQPQFQDIDNKSQEEEVKHFTENSDKTSQEIQKEKEFDISTPAGRVELSKQPKDVQPSNEEENLLLNKQNQDLENKDKVEKQEVEKQEDIDQNVEKISGVQEKIFQQGICPVTGESLVKSSKVVGDFLGIYSPNGGTEYAVNLNTGEIFRYKA